MQGIERTVSLWDDLLYHGYLDCADDVERAQWEVLLADWARRDALANYDNGAARPAVI